MIMRRRHQQILDALADGRMLSVEELVEAVGVSPATIRRDLTQLASLGMLRKIRGGAEALDVDRTHHLTGSSFRADAGLHVAEKKAIAELAVRLCADDETVIINGGTTTQRMAEYMTDRSMQVLTNSFAMADYLLRYTNNGVVLPGGEVYREQNVILSPYEKDTVIDHFYAAKMFSGAHALRPQGMIETDPLLIKAEQKLINQAEELIVLVDSSKFRPRGSLISCPLERISTVITDSGVSDKDVAMLETAGVKVLVAELKEIGREPGMVPSAFGP